MTGQEMIREGREILRELDKKMRKAEDEYLDLRDAKSDGCCHGLSIGEVLQYDAKIDKAARLLNEARDEYYKACDELAKLRKEYGYEE